MYDWIIIKMDKEPAVQKCLRCGMVEPMPFNKPLGYAIKLMNAFLDYHSDCEEKESMIFSSYHRPLKGDDIGYSC